MNRAYFKYFALILLVMFTCSGCKQDNLIDESLLDVPRPAEVIKYRSGAVLLKNNENDYIKNQNRINNLNKNYITTNFAPSDVNLQK